MSTIQGVDLIQFRQNLASSFSPGELEILCFDLNIPSGDIPGPEQSNKAIQIISYCQRHGLFLNLITYCSEARPHLQWRQEIQSQLASFETVEARKKHRKKLYEEADGIQLVHTILPSQRRDDHWDILIYLIRHKSNDLSIVDHAEFFLGRYWDNEIFHANNSEDFIGIAISAYGPVLCTCRVVFTTGEDVMLSRYIDFEMTHLYPKSAPAQPMPKSLPGIEPKKLSYFSQATLAKRLSENFAGVELDLLVARLGVQIEKITLSSGSAKAFDVVRFFAMRNQLPELLELCRQQRPEGQWDDVYA